MIYPVGWPYVSVEHVENSEELIIQPNPMEDRMTVLLTNSSSPASSYRILGVDGRIYREMTVTPDQRITVERGNLAAGVYLIEITSTDGHRLFKKFIAR
jgi:hypothetical protein